MARPWLIAGVALAGGVVIGHYLWPTPVSGGGGGGSQGPADTRPPAARIARDMMNACHDLEPFLLQLEAALQDRTISVSEGAALVQQVRRLT